MSYALKNQIVPLEFLISSEMFKPSHETIRSFGHWWIDGDKK